MFDVCFLRSIRKGCHCVYSKSVRTEQKRKYKYQFALQRTENTVVI